MERMKNPLADCAALLSGAAIGADNGPLPKDLYVRGAFNGWGTDNVLAYKGKGVYEAQIVGQPRQPRLQGRLQGLDAPNG